MQRFGEKLQDEQEVLSYIADIVIDTYAAESAVLGAGDRRVGNASLHIDAGQRVCHEAAGRIELAARSCLAAMADGDVLRTQMAALRRLSRSRGQRRGDARRLADATVAKGGYPLLMA